MLTLSRSQLKAFEGQATERHHQALLSHLSKHFPGHATSLGESGLSRFIRHGLGLARRHGFDTERDQCLYIDLAFMLGIGFDSDPQLEWAQEILEDPNLVDPRGRMDDLWDQALCYMDRVLGPRGAFPTMAWRAAQRQRLERAHCFTVVGEDRLLAQFHDIWPEKACYVGGKALRSMAAQAQEAALRYGILHDTEQVEFCILSFLFGHRFYEDPLYPWVDEILTDGRAWERERKLGRLLDAFDEYFAVVLG